MQSFSGIFRDFPAAKQDCRLCGLCIGYGLCGLCPKSACARSLSKIFA
ncbi:MAG: methylenetetrahydrofolate reductase C-terminal domain-containing protein [Muribaculaceae bacterium]|nr:methylenetetrahydrofolate reductase C-terminal domain-containing protein [Muribaculaceae bacterium]